MHASNAKTEGKKNLLAHSMGNNILLYFECQLHFVGFTEKTYCICGEEGMEWWFIVKDGQDCPIGLWHVSCAGLSLEPNGDWLVVLSLFIRNKFLFQTNLDSHIL